MKNAVGINWKKRIVFLIDNVCHKRRKLCQSGKAQSVILSFVKVMVSVAPDIIIQQVQELHHSPADHAFILDFCGQGAGHDITLIDHQDILLLGSDLIQIMTDRLHPPNEPLFVLPIDLIGLEGAVSVVRMNNGNLFRR